MPSEKFKKVKSISKVNKDIRLKTPIREELDKHFMVISFDAKIYTDYYDDNNVRKIKEVNYTDLVEERNYTLGFHTNNGVYEHFLAEYIGMGIFSLIAIRNKTEIIKIGRYFIISPYSVEKLKTFNKYVLNSYEQIYEKKTLTKQEIVFRDVENLYNCIKNAKQVKFNFENETKVFTNFKYLSRVSTNYVLIEFEEEAFLIENDCLKGFNISL